MKIERPARHGAVRLGVTYAPRQSPFPDLPWRSVTRPDGVTPSVGWHPTQADAQRAIQAHSP